MTRPEFQEPRRCSGGVKQPLLLKGIETQLKVITISTYLDAVIFTGCDEDRLTWYPFNACNCRVVCAADHVQQTAALIEIPESYVPG